MKLAVLASKAARLPEIDFEWPGPEQYDVYKGKVQIGYQANLAKAIKRQMALL